MWDSLSERERIQYTLLNLSEIYGDIVWSEFVSGASFSWSQNPYSAGAFTAMEPGQELELYPYIPVPEGRIHFAGEHASLMRGCKGRLNLESVPLMKLIVYLRSCSVLNLVVYNKVTLAFLHLPCYFI